jgi:pectin methylesterase-like acyl-CoA thioesterase
MPFELEIIGFSWSMMGCTNWFFFPREQVVFRNGVCGEAILDDKKWFALCWSKKAVKGNHEWDTKGYFS